MIQGNIKGNFQIEKVVLEFEKRQNNYPYMVIRKVPKLMIDQVSSYAEEYLKSLSTLSTKINIKAPHICLKFIIENTRTLLRETHINFEAIKIFI